MRLTDIKRLQGYDRRTAIERCRSCERGTGGFQSAGRRVYRASQTGRRPHGDIDVTKKPIEIAGREVAIGQAIRNARVNAKPGAIFTPEAAAILKRIIAENYRRSPAVRETTKDAEAELPDFTPVVNQPYPSTHPLATFPATLLKVLPPLPELLEYRFVTHHLILRDTEANLIVDVLPNAVP